MKTVFENSMVAHIWAQQKQSSGRSNNGNFHFTEDVIYSYRTPIARIVKDKKGSPVALITSQKFSVTTEGKHKNAIHRALGYGRLMPYFIVQHIGITGGHSDRSLVSIMCDKGRPPHAENKKAMLAAYEAEKKRVLKAVKYHDSNHLRAIYKMMFDYCQHFGLAPPRVNLEADALAIHEYHNTPEKIAKRKLNAERVIERENAALVARFEKEKERREKWLSGDESEGRYWHGSDENGGAYLRIRGDIVETSQGASFPLDHARRAYAFIKNVRGTGIEWKHNGHSIRVGLFTIDSIDQAGNVRAGCHFIKWPEIVRIAMQGGFAGDESSDAALELTKESA